MARNLEFDIKAENAEFWTSRERRLWTLALFFGLMLAFMGRTVGPVTMVALAKEFDWNKDTQVQHLCLKMS